MTTTTIEQFREQCIQACKGMHDEDRPDDYADAIAALPLPAMPSQSDDLIILPRGLVAAACSVIDKKRDAPVVLAKLREYAIGLPVMPEQAEPVYLIWQYSKQPGNWVIATKAQYEADKANGYKVRIAF